MKPVIVIPARIGSTRLPRKALADIAGKPMILRVVERISVANFAPVFVATDDEEIKRVVESAGVRAIMTDKNCASGSDRVYQALCQIDSENQFDVVVNIQGDMPTIDASIIASTFMLLENKKVDIGTLAAKISSLSEIGDPAVVKPVISWEKPGEKGRAFYFSRSAVPNGAAEFYHHIGVYAYRRDALKRFIELPPSDLEKTEKLEQLRAIEAGMRIDIAVVDTIPIGVDTEEGLLKARKFYE